jgi:hypothetical protein
MGKAPPDHFSVPDGIGDNTTPTRAELDSPSDVSALTAVSCAAAVLPSIPTIVPAIQTLARRLVMSILPGAAGTIGRIRPARY